MTASGAAPGLAASAGAAPPVCSWGGCSGAGSSGAQIAEDPEGLARALLKLQRGAQLLPHADAPPATASLFIVNPLAGVEGVMALVSTHPRIEERVRRLRALDGAESRLGLAS